MLYQGKYSLYKIELNRLEKLFLPFVIPTKMTANEIWECLDLYDLVYPGNTPSEKGQLIFLRDFIEKRKRAYNHDAFSQCLEQAYLEKLHVKAAQNNDKSLMFIAFLPFNEQMKFFSAVEETFKHQQL